MSKMKAWKLTKYGKDFKAGMEILEVGRPSPADDEVLIECHAVALNPVDYKIAEGQLKLFYKQKMPAGLAFDCSGVVAEVDKKVEHLKVGDEVFCTTPTDSPGVLAEFVAVKADVVTQKPKNLSHAEAAGFAMVGLTTISCMEAVDLKAGEKILIHAGSGGVGSFAIQYARQLGAEVFTTTSTSNVDWVEELGAKVIDYKKEDYRKVVPQLDVVYDTLGGDFTTDAFPLLSPGGRVVSIAGRRLDEETAEQYGLNWLFKLFMKLQLRPINKLCKKYDASYKFILNEPNMERLSKLKKALETGYIKPVINHTYSFDQVVEAFEMQQSGRSKGKNVILIK
ncbi:NADP-dependent oxidoreductase [Owenweeksia hongkongensis]|uniref:NADP-dependent oxidoreductase n=1 Tax=Owenweeksia hongkongensis TaxID=253245 RepID=UPI003A92B322